MRRSLLKRQCAWLPAALLVFQAAAAVAQPEVYFSPNGGIRPRLLRAINLTQATIDLAVFDFTSGELAGAAPVKAPLTVRPRRGRLSSRSTRWSS